MPLVQGSNKETVSKNIKIELKAGRPRAQAIAIALETARRNRRKARKNRKDKRETKYSHN